MRVNLLGEIQLWNETDRIPASAFPTRKVVELLLILLQQSTHYLSLDQLVEHLWPARNPEAARKNLHVTAGHLRRVLEPQLKRPADSTYLLTEADGTGQKQLTYDPDVGDGFAEWSPDGQWITYTSTRINSETNCCANCCVTVYMMKSDGSGQRKLTSEIDSTWMATWQP